jgi:capsid protein
MRPLNLAETHSQLRQDYDAAKASRLRKRRILPASGSGADYHYRNESDYLRMMEYGRDLDRNDSIIGSILDRAEINTIQDGATLDFDTGSVTLDQELLGGWLEWGGDADLCDVAGELTFAEMEAVTFRASKADGDIWGLLTDDEKIQLWEGHRVRTPHRTTRPIVHGVQLGTNRQHERVYVTNDDIGFASVSPPLKEMSNYPVRDESGLRRVLQVHTQTSKRVSQTRGISAFNKMFDLAGMLDDAQFAALLKQQLQNALVFVENKSDIDDGGPDEPLGPETRTSHPDGRTEVVQGMGPGTILKPKKGRRLDPFMSTAGGPDFIGHVKLILTLLGVNLGMPLVLVLMDAKETNFSGWRAAFEQAKMGFRRNQNRMLKRWNNPVLKWHLALRKQKNSALERALDKAVAASRKSGVNWYTWHLPTWPYVNPIDDRMADLIAVANYQEAPSTNMAKNSMDFDRETKRGIEDRGRATEWAIKEAERLNKKYPNLTTPVDYQMFYTAPQPKHVSASISQSRDSQQAKGEANAVNA